MTPFAWSAIFAFGVVVVKVIELQCDSDLEGNRSWGLMFIFFCSGFAKASGGKSSIFKAKSHKSSSSSSSDSSSDEDDFVADCLKAHNNYRKKHGVPLLKISKDVSILSTARWNRSVVYVVLRNCWYMLPIQQKPCTHILILLRFLRCTHVTS